MNFMIISNYVKNLSKEKIIRLFELDQENSKQLFQAAYETKVQNVGKNVYLRGLIEFSNYCSKDCFYCGIRRSNKQLHRYEMSKQEIIDSALWAHKQNYGSIVLQSGERSDDRFIAFVEEIVTEIKKLSNDKLGITLSLGEQSLETYKRWYKAGAHRYLLRIETSNPKLYSELHPDDHRFDQRLKSVQHLKEVGYQTGTGVMIGLPEQTTEDLADDIIFFKKNDIDMIGMGPYVIHHNTPLAEKCHDFNKERQLELTLKMIALTRLYCPDINIAATTALQTIDPLGREKGLLAGANILMPNVGETKYRKHYFLYDDKPCVDDEAQYCQRCLEKRIESIGEKIGYGVWGDSPHFQRRKHE